MPSPTGLFLSNPNELDDRPAMGLPAAFVDRLPADLPAAVRDLVADPAHLALRVEDRRLPLAARLAAGQLLALTGDPRIRPDDPQLVHVPGGRFRMGATEGEVDEAARRYAHVGVTREWLSKELPAHEREVPDVAIMRYPVTHLEWRRFLLETDGAPPDSWRFGAFPAHAANHPVWTVEPQEAEAYAAWLSARTGRRFRLPTEAEWEFVAGGGADERRREHPWGDTPPGPEHANVIEHGPITTTPVGCFPAGASAHGVLDLGGNVEEYVADDYRPYPGAEHIADDLARRTGGYRIARGGGFTRFGDLTRTRRRHGRFPRDLYAMGFRLVETTEQPGRQA